MRTGVRRWLLDGLADRATDHPGPHRAPVAEHKTHPWWKVMCLTGVDYFSTLGYQPGIAALAAGVISPFATMVLILLTLLGALPVYRRVAKESPHGEGSIAMLEKVLPWWGGKLFVLALLGFACTDFLITMTLSAADATAHLEENPFAPSFLHGQEVLITLVLLALLGGVFLKGFTEAVGIAVGLVSVYLSLNLVVLLAAFYEVATHPTKIGDWSEALTTSHGSPFAVIAVALLVFPKLALGLSGFETGVAVMPQIRGRAGDTERRPVGRIAGARRLLTTAALTMSCFLMASSFCTTVLIPEKEFESGGEANGRALAYLAHEHLGEVFGTIYDLSTIAILWFAGASAMAGLLNLVPRYLPRYGMAPEWARAVRPLVLLFTAVAFVVTILFDADVDAQGGAYATGVLVLMTSAAIAVTLSAHRRGRRPAMIGFGTIAAIFTYTTIANVIERPDGVKIAALFIVAIVATSFASRVQRAFELRATEVTLDETAARLVAESVHDGVLEIVANEPNSRDASEYAEKEAEARERHHLPAAAPVLFLEVTVADASEFASDLHVVGEERDGYRVLSMRAASVPNSVAALLLHVRDTYDVRPHVYFEWTEGNPIVHLLKFLFVGAGEVAPVAREVLRRAEPDRTRRPFVHVG
ncbi:amino acid transporter [Cryptosporangium aurantiacum]|uniref:Amino acid permease n=1 Tax=Cryptosporangium aurantiacum TaxID=134849 RepID=A0A1M7J325_9ACTN|nr:hypothetical protein SAMN05443668_101670 [Cryptosporangium aurantiacum]